MPLILSTSSISTNVAYTGITIDTLGRVNFPNQPSFTVTAQIYSPTTNYTSVVILNSVTTQNFSTLYNNGGNFNASTGLFTAPIAGKYFFTAQFSRQSGNATVAVYKNGGQIGQASLTYGADWQTGSQQFVMNMAVGDTASCAYGAVNGTTVNGYGVWFSGYLIG
jgi:hypothetical protein